MFPGGERSARVRGVRRQAHATPRWERINHGKPLPGWRQGAADTVSRDVGAGTWPRSRGGELSWPDCCGISQRCLFRVESHCHWMAADDGGWAGCLTGLNDLTGRRGYEPAYPPGYQALRITPFLRVIPRAGRRGRGARTGTRPRSPDGALNWPGSRGFHQRPIYRWDGLPRAIPGAVRRVSCPPGAWQTGRSCRCRRQSRGACYFT